MLIAFERPINEEKLIFAEAGSDRGDRWAIPDRVRLVGRGASFSNERSVGYWDCLCAKHMIKTSKNIKARRESLVD